MTPTGRSPNLTLRRVALIVIVLVCTALGAWRAASMAAAKPDPSTLVVNGVSYTVAHVEQVKGLSDSDLGGMAHGIQSLVSDDKTLVKVSLVVTAGDSPTSYDASALRAYAAGSSVGVSPAGGTLSPGRLSAHSRMEGSLSFVFPRNGAQVALRAPGDPREVALLRVDKAPSGTVKHQHPSGTAKQKPSGTAKQKPSGTAKQEPSGTAKQEPSGTAKQEPSGTAKHQHPSATPDSGGTSPLNHR